MRKIYLLLLFVSPLLKYAIAAGRVHDSTNLNHAFAIGSTATGVTVAGNTDLGYQNSLLKNPNAVFVDGNGNVFASSPTTNTIQKWVSGRLVGDVAGSGGSGNGAENLSLPKDVFVDLAGNVYVADFNNYRVQKWAPGASQGITIAGGNSWGPAANQITPAGIFVDAAGAVYVADSYSNRIQKWSPGAIEGITVAGANGVGTAANQLNTPASIFIDGAGNMYISDQKNFRVQKWAPGASAGVTVAGGNGQGAEANQLGLPGGIHVDASGNIYIADPDNFRIQKWAPGATEGITVAGGNGPGFYSISLSFPQDVFADGTGIFVPDYGYNRIQKFGFPVSGSSATGTLVAGGNGRGSAANQLYRPLSVDIDAAGNLYIAELANNRVQKWGPGATSGVTVAGGNGQGSAANQISPTGISLDASTNIYIADPPALRIQKWAPDAVTGITVAGANGPGSGAGALGAPNDVFIDATGNIYAADQGNYRIQKWAPGATAGITVAGGRGQGSAANQFSGINGVYVDKAGAVYVSDGPNHRIQKWYPGGTAGATVAGGNGQGPGASQLDSPEKIFVDSDGNLFIADAGNHRIQKWTNNATSGITVAGGNGEGSALNQLSRPTDITLDAAGNLYIADSENDRVVKYGAATFTGLNYKFYQGNYTVLPEFGSLTPVKTGASANIDLVDRPAGVNENYAALWEGNIYLGVSGNYTFETISDDGSRLYLNSKYFAGAKPLVDNDGLHEAVSVKAEVTINSGGVLPIAISYFNATGGSSFQAYFSGMGIPRQPIPDFAFSQANVSDRTSPTAVSNLHVVSKGSNSVRLDWNNSTDNVGVIGYKINNSNYTEFITRDSEIFIDSLLPNTSYTINIAARDLSGNFSPSAIITFVTDNSVTGLNYKYYEGSWDVLPDFSQLTPVTKGISNGADIGIRPTGRNDNFAFLWEGYINIDTAGTYIFETVSDDGSKLYFNSKYTQSATATVSNDGLHAAVASSGSVAVPFTGLYPIAITFFEKDGGESMQVYWTRPGHARELIPATAFRQSDRPSELSYKYYEGEWSSLPDFTKLTPVKTGTSADVDIIIRPAGRNDNFAFLWEGHINIPVAGNYTFETLSDDGSRLYFNSLYLPASTPTVSNDGLHAETSSTGTVFVPAAGSYPIAISYFEKDGGETMKLFWSGPGFDRRPIPASAFGLYVPDMYAPFIPQNVTAVYAGKTYVHLSWSDSYDVAFNAYDVYVNDVKKYSCTEPGITVDGLNPNTTYTFTIRARDFSGNVSMPSSPVMATTTATVTGLNYLYYEGTWTALPNFNTLQYPAKTIASPNVDINLRRQGINDHFGFLWEGYINIKTPGTYTFETVSDDGSRLYFNSLYVPGATPLVDNDGVHAANAVTGTVNIPAAGLYPIAVTYFENEGGETMQVYWSGPGITRQIIPNSAFVETSASLTSNQNIGSIPGNAANADLIDDKITISKVYPDPFADKFKVDFYNTTSTNDITLIVRDLTGRTVYSHHAGKLVLGNNTINVNLNHAHLPNGVYLLTLHVNGLDIKTVKMMKTKR